MDKATAPAPPGGRLSQASPAPVGDIGTLKLLSSKATWAIIVVNFVNHWGYFIYLNWMPSYFIKALGVDLRSSSFLSFLPWTVMAVGSSAAGFSSCLLLVTRLYCDVSACRWLKRLHALSCS